MQICIVGTGYVGLVSAACFAEMGSDVICVDINAKIVERLKRGEVHIYEPGLEDLVKRNVQNQNLSFTTNLPEAIKNTDFIFITVGTPACEDGSCDLSFVEQVAREIGQHMEDTGRLLLVVNKSTVPVGTADLVKKIIDAELVARKLKVNYEVVSNPEFLKRGRRGIGFYEARSCNCGHCKRGGRG